MNRTRQLYDLTYTLKTPNKNPVEIDENAPKMYPAIIKVVMLNGTPEVDISVEYDDYEFLDGDGFFGWIPRNQTNKTLTVPFRYTPECWYQVGFTRSMDGIDGEKDQREFLAVLNSVLPENVTKPTCIKNLTGKVLTRYI